MKVGLVGYGNSGKSTVFALLAEMASVPGDSKDPVRIADVKVADPRLNRLAQMAQPKKVTPAEFEILDLTAHYHGADGGTDFVPHLTRYMAQAEAWIHVVRAFDNEAFPAPREGASPEASLDGLEVHFQLHDLGVVERRLERIEEERSKGVKTDSGLVKALEKSRDSLQKEIPLRRVEFDEQEDQWLRGFHLLSKKPTLVVFNVNEDAYGEGARWSSLCRERSLPWMAFSAGIELEISQLPPDERAGFMADLGIERPARDRFLLEAFGLLGRITFFTVGDRELRAWPVPRGTPAAKAAGTIHSDMERGFIRAEVLGYEDFVDSGGFAGARKEGRLRVEGKDYVVRDGDILHIRFNV